MNRITIALIVASTFLVLTVRAQPNQGQQTHFICLYDSNPDISMPANLATDQMALPFFAYVPDGLFELHNNFGQGVDRASLINAIDNVRVDSNDTIFFYYCGHGYMNQRGVPFVLPGGDPQPLYLKDVLLRLKNKKARKTIALFDCCQAIRTDRWVRPAPQAPESISPFMKSLLFDEPSSVPKCLISSGAGEYAVAAYQREGEDDLLHGSLFAGAFATVAAEHQNESLPFAQFIELLKTQTDSDFKRIKISGAVFADGKRLSNLEQRTQTVTPYLPIEIR